MLPLLLPLLLLLPPPPGPASRGAVSASCRDAGPDLLLVSSWGGNYRYDGRYLLPNDLFPAVLGLRETRGPSHVG